MKPLVGVGTVPLHGRVPWFDDYVPPASQQAVGGDADVVTEDADLTGEALMHKPHGPHHDDGITEDDAAIGTHGVTVAERLQEGASDVAAAGGRVASQVGTGAASVGTQLWWCIKSRLSARSEQS